MSVSRNQIYKCPHCGNVVEVVSGQGPTPVCCGQLMDQMVENDTDAATEKHVPVLEKVDGGYKVTVGSVAHPMGDDHLIEWIELLADGVVYRRHLAPSDPPEAFFALDASDVTARAYCNLHGLWKS